MAKPNWIAAKHTSRVLFRHGSGARSVVIGFILLVLVDGVVNGVLDSLSTSKL